jgi:ABC-2 type transport system permease protein
MRTELYFSMLLILIVGPNLISQDLRYNALPLYFSRPLRRFDYFLGKWGVIFTFLAAVTILPAIAAYVLGLLFSLDLSIIRQTLPILLASVAYGFLISASAGTFILALSSLSRNSRYVALFWLAVWLGSGAVAGVLMEIDYENRQHAAWRAGQGPFLSEGAELQAAQFDWRPTVSYATNLARLGEEMLGTANAWNKLAELVGNQSYRLKTAQYPWTWSLGVLAGLFGLSACILHLSIKSLDRLK